MCGFSLYLYIIKIKMRCPSLIYTACNNNDLDSLSCLITRTNVNTRYKQGTVLEIACSVGSQCEIPCWLLDEMYAKEGYALYYAVNARNTAVITYLLSRGIDPNSVDICGHTVVTHVNNIETLEMFLRAGAKPCARLCREFEKLVPSSDIIKLLLDYGAHIGHVDHEFPIPKWIYDYEQLCEEKRQEQYDSAVAFLCVCKRMGIPKDLSRDIVKRMILTRKVHVQQRLRKRTKNE